MFNMFLTLEKSIFVKFLNFFLKKNLFSVEIKPFLNVLFKITSWKESKENFMHENAEKIRLTHVGDFGWINYLCMMKMSLFCQLTLSAPLRDAVKSHEAFFTNFPPSIRSWKIIFFQCHSQSWKEIF